MTSAQRSYSAICKRVMTAYAMGEVDYINLVTSLNRARRQLALRQHKEAPCAN